MHTYIVYAEYLTAERHENGTLQPSFLAAHQQSSGSSNPAQAVLTVVPSAGMHSSQEFQSRQSSRSPAATPSFSPSPYSSATSSPRGSTTSGHYFSTVLSHASGEQSASGPTSSSIAHAGSDQAHHSRQGPQRQTALERDNKKGQKHEK